MSDPLRVGFFATALGGGGGMERYARELLSALGRRIDVELVVVTTFAGQSEPELLAPDNLRDVLVLPDRGSLTRSLTERFRVGRELERHGARVVHGTKHLVPRTELPTVLTVQDVMVLERPEYHPRLKSLLLPSQYRASLREAAVLIAVTEVTQRHLARIDERLADKTVVVPNGVALGLLQVAPAALAGLGHRRFALVVGDLSPRKNVDLLINAWDEVARRTDGLLLVVVGPDGWRSGATRRRLARLAARDMAFWAHRVSDAQLRWCYEHAEVVLAPSKEEGFGLPIVEALALNAPIVASTDDALIEVGQGRPRHIDPDDVDGWIEAIEKTITQGRAPHPRPISLPSWDECADGTIAAYRRAVAISRP